MVWLLKLETKDDMDHDFTGSTQEEWHEWAERIRQNEALSPSEKADLIDGTPMPEEQYEERLERDRK